MITPPLPTISDALKDVYGSDARLCSSANDKLTLVFSQTRPFDLVELEQLLEAVGWSRRPVRRVRKALANSFVRLAPKQRYFLTLMGVTLLRLLKSLETCLL